MPVPSPLYLADTYGVFDQYYMHIAYGYYTYLCGAPRPRTEREVPDPPAERRCQKCAEAYAAKTKESTDAEA